MSDIFLSYAREDLPQARRLANALEALGFSVFWDRRILPGQAFDEVISQALKAANCVIALWSAVSVASPWVKDEAAEGLDRHILVPALISEVVPLLGFRRVHAANLIGWQEDAQHPEFQNFVDSVGRILTRQKENQAGDKNSQVAPRENVNHKILPLTLESRKSIENKTIIAAEFGIKLLLVILPLIIFSYYMYNIYAPRSSTEFKSLLRILFYLYNISFIVLIVIGCIVFLYFNQFGHKLIITTSIFSVFLVGIYLTYYIINNYYYNKVLTPLNNILIISGIFSFISIINLIAVYLLFKKYSSSR